MVLLSFASEEVDPAARPSEKALVPLRHHHLQLAQGPRATRTAGRLGYFQNLALDHPDRPEDQPGLEVGVVSVAFADDVCHLIFSSTSPFLMLKGDIIGMIMSPSFGS
jgi:hypothetical protein